MKLQTSFNAFGYGRCFYLKTDEIERNYADEGYAYWICEDEDGHVYEIDIWKDEQEGGAFTSNGKAHCYESNEQFEDGRGASEEVEIKFSICDYDGFSFDETYALWNILDAVFGVGVFVPDDNGENMMTTGKVLDLETVSMEDYLTIKGLYNIRKNV